MHTGSARHLEISVTGLLVVVVLACSAWGHQAYAKRKALNDRLAAVIEWSNTREIRALVRRGADPTTRAPSGRTVLMVGAETGDLALMREALTWGVPVSAADTYGSTALHHAIRRDSKLDGVELLLRATTALRDLRREGKAERVRAFEQVPVHLHIDREHQKRLRPWK